MLRINILPVKIKNELKLENALKSIVGLFYFAIIISSLAATILIIASFSFKVTQRNNPNNGFVFKDNNAEIYDEITILNTKLENVDIMQGNFIKWSLLLDEISKNTSNEIKYTGISISKNENFSILLKGTAETRDSVLSLKKFLEDTPVFSNIDFPLQNILEKTDINFTIKATINQDEINR